MSENEFKSLMIQAEILTTGDYLRGYQHGLRRHYHGSIFRTEQEHNQWLKLIGCNEELCNGYRDGFTGVAPVVRIEQC